MAIQFEKLTGVLARLLKVSADQLLTGFRPAKPEEVAEVSRLRQPDASAKFADRDHDYLHWRYFSRTPQVVDLWVLERGDEIIAAIGLERMVFQAEAGEEVFVKIIDLIVRKDLQALGIAPWMCLRVKEQFDRVLVIGSNDSSIRITKQLWSSINIMQKFAHPLDLTAWVRFRYPSNRLLPLVSYPANWLLHGVRLISAKCYARGWQIEQFSDLKALGQLVQQAAGTGAGHQHPMQTQRDADYFAWRFDAHPRRRFRANALLDPNGRLVAYLVCTADELETRLRRRATDTLPRFLTGDSMRWRQPMR